MLGSRTRVKKRSCTHGYGNLSHSSLPRMSQVSCVIEMHRTDLSNYVPEFVPYVFQIFAALLEAAPTSPLPANFSSLLGPILAPTVWETRGNVPGCARFLSAMVPKAKQAIVESQQLVQILGIFQRLLASKKTESNAFDILESVVATFDG